MTSRPNIELLVDILNLYRKYGARAFSSLAHQIRSGALMEKLVEVIEVTEGVGRGNTQDPLRPSAKKKSIRSKRTPKEALIDDILDMALSRDECDRHVANFLREAMRKNILATENTLREFVVHIGLRDDDVKRDRSSTLRRIARALRERPRDQMQRDLEFGSKITSDSSTLDQWSEIIVKE